jgi:signal transduction histidine kinase
MPWLRRTSYGLAALTATLVLATLVFAVLVPSRATLLQLGVALLVGPATAAISVVISRRERGLLVGALLGLVGATTVHVCAKESFREWLATDHERARSFAWLEGVWSQSALLVLMAVALLLLYFPDGYLPSRRWRWVPPVIVASTLLDQVRSAFMEPIRAPLDFLAKPFPSLPAWLDLALEAAFFVMVALVFASAGSILVRYRGADRIQKQQIKWLALGGFGVVLYPPLCLIEILLLGETWWVSVAVVVTGLVGIPAAIGVAMVRHDLYDVDKAWAGAVTWALLTGGLVGIYAIGSSVVGALVGRDSAPAAAIATALCAVAFLPLRRSLQRVVDARLYPQRRAGVAAIEKLHRDVDAGAAVPETLEDALRTALRDPELRVGYRLPGRDQYVDAREQPVPASLAVRVDLAGEPIGILVPGSDGPSHELLFEVAARATTMVEVVRVRQELGWALREVEASRARLVQIGFEERRRLERDLHDGAQQRLVALGMSLRLAQRHLGDETVDVGGLMDEAVAEIGTAVAELRQIAHGLRPSALDDGLPAALSRLVRNLPMPIDMQIEEVTLPDDVATTAYFVIAEAITNAIKHAEATSIRLRVGRADGAVQVHVSDDGRGGAILGTGSVLADRVAALGGSLSVASPLGRGTTVEVALPCAS